MAGADLKQAQVNLMHFKCRKAKEKSYQKENIGDATGRWKLINYSKTTQVHQERPWSTISWRHIPRSSPSNCCVNNLGARAEMRRPTDTLNFCKTLDDLFAGLLKESYVLSCKKLFLWLIPDRSDNAERK